MTKITQIFLVIVALLAPALTVAGTYTVSYSGGSCLVTGGSPGGAYSALSGGGWGGGGTGQSVTCGGAITATFTWSGTGTPPSSVIVIQQGTASAWEYPTATAGSVSDGLGDSQVTSSGLYPPSSVQSSSSLNPHYSIKNVANATTFTVTCTPTATAGSSSAANASVSYTASCVPLDIVLTGGATDATTKLQDFLIGQQVNATLSLPSGFTNSTYSWTAADCTPFKTYSASTAAGVLTPLGSETSSSFSLFFAGLNGGGGTGHVNCAVTLTCTANGEHINGTA